MTDLIRRDDAYAAIRGLTRHIDRIAAITALPAVQPDDDKLVWTMTKLIAAGLDRIEALTAERDRLREALTELLEVSRRAVRLSAEHDNFKLYAMEPMERAILLSRAALKGESHE